MATIEASQLGPQWKQLLDEVTRTGSPLTITNQGEVIAQLTTPGHRARTLFGLHKGQVTIHGDINSQASEDTESAQ